ncbi:DMT family transporter [Sphaerotilus sp.]|uniref:DMT family transporter n=1 Tax=Sphaerotilus sp. TaxID=2093942 RepID=UPI0025F6B4E4|nr:DMT family transporter [Sphaerotilus sp.]
MKPRDFADLTLLAALWGGSFLFMRYAAPAFGALPLMWLRVTIATACLLPLLVWRGQAGALRARIGVVTVMGLFNSAIPFVLIAWATLSITAGLASILNATVPIMTALIGAVWLHDRLGAGRLAGLMIGMAGVVLLAADKADFKPGGSGWALLAMVAATACYGFAANVTKRYLTGVPPMVNAAGSQIVSAVALTPFALWSWPVQTPGALAWGAAAALGIGCTAVAYVLFFRLIARIGASRAVTVTFLVPVFGILWGALFLGEVVTLPMLLGGAVVLVGTGLSTGWIRWPGGR